MSNLMGFTTARKTSRAELVASWLDGGEVRIYDGTRPATADTAISTQTLLVTLALPHPSGTVTSGVWTAGEIDVAMIAETGTAAWARIVTSAGVTVFDADVGVVGSGALIEIDNLSLVTGGYCTVVSFTLTER